MPRNYSKEDKRYMTKDITPQYPTDAVDTNTGRRVIDGPIDVKRSNKVFSNTGDRLLKNSPDADPIKDEDI